MSFLHYKIIYPDQNPVVPIPRYNDFYEHSIRIPHAPRHVYKLYHYQPRYSYTPYQLDMMYK
jgi:hypothetical protein